MIRRFGPIPAVLALAAMGLVAGALPDLSDTPRLARGKAGVSRHAGGGRSNRKQRRRKKAGSHNRLRSR